jgi:CTP-dependent riboflavin kinase
LFDTLTFAEILGWTTFLGTLSLTVLSSNPLNDLNNENEDF